MICEGTGKTGCAGTPAAVWHDRRICAIWLGSLWRIFPINPVQLEDFKAEAEEEEVQQKLDVERGESRCLQKKT